MKKWHTVKMTIAEIAEIVENSTITDSLFNRLQTVLHAATGDERLRTYLKERGWHRRDLGDRELWVPPREAWPKGQMFEPLGYALASAVQRQKRIDRSNNEVVTS